MPYQIFAAIDDAPLEPHRKYDKDETGRPYTEIEAMDGFAHECTVAQHSADYLRKRMTLELRNTSTGIVMAHRSFDPRDLSGLEPMPIV
jgi:hypothetical protein